MKEVSWLFEPGSNVGHVAKAGRKAAYGLGSKPLDPDPALREVFCGHKAPTWTTISLDLERFEPDDAPPVACPACCKAAGVVVRGQQALPAGGP